MLGRVITPRRTDGAQDSSSRKRSRGTHSPPSISRGTNGTHFAVTTSRKKTKRYIGREVTLLLLVFHRQPNHPLFLAAAGSSPSRDGSDGGATEAVESRVVVPELFDDVGTCFCACTYGDAVNNREQAGQKQNTAIKQNEQGKRAYMR